MEECIQTITDYGLRSVGIGQRLLPKEDFTLCQQVTLIGSGMIWNIYFGILALLFGFFLATGLAVAKAAQAGIGVRFSPCSVGVFAWALGIRACGLDFVGAPAGKEGRRQGQAGQGGGAAPQ